MSRTLALTLLLVVLLGSLSMAVDAQNTKPRPSPGRPSDQEPGNGTGHEPRRQAGRLDVANETVTGRYVAFTLDLASCVVRDYRVYGLLLFAEIRLPGTECRIANGGPAGRIEIRSANAQLRAHDAPNALLQVQAREDDIQAVLGPDASITADDDALTIALGNLTGRAFSRNETALNFTDGVLRLEDGTIMFQPASGTSAERREIFQAIQKGKVGAETDIVVENGSLVSEVLTYDDVQLRVQRKAEDRFDFTVGGNLSQGRVFVTNFDPSAWDPARMRVDYADVDGDGRRHPVLIRQADGLDEVLDFDPGKGPVYFVFEDQDGWHAAVAVPEFSVHVFQVVGLPLQVVPLLLYGIVIGGLFLAAGGVGIMMERRQRAAR